MKYIERIFEQKFPVLAALTESLPTVYGPNDSLQETLAIVFLFSLFHCA